MNDKYAVWNELNVLLISLEEQKRKIYLLYQELVNAVLLNKITSEREIETIMEGLLDFGDDEMFLTLYQNLCRHVYIRYPELVGEYPNVFRLQFEEREE